MSDVIRAGYISAVNYQDGTAQVVYKDRDNSTSPYMPVWSNEYNMPDIDTLVYVVHLQNGGTRGMILVPPYTDDNKPVEGKKGIWRKDFGDGSYIRYLTVDGGIKAKTINTTGNVHIGGDLTVDGSYPG